MMISSPRYRHAEMIVRNRLQRLQRLQASVGETIKAVNCIEQRVGSPPV